MDGTQNVSNLFSDGRRLYVASDAGTTAWDIESRKQVAAFPGFVARLICRSRRSLVAFGPDTIEEVALDL
jgi:CO dehydrogenase/acetyl-CoA synthase epsilon subunit